MDRGKAISLNNLTISHGDQIDMMVAGINGNPGAALWTAELRAATRGGKCALATPTLSDSTD
jgi:hypothetical protein